MNHDQLPVYTIGGRPENWRLIPSYMREGLREWIEHGRPQGSFLMAVLRNDLKEACTCADETNRNELFNYVTFLYRHAPIGSWGGEKECEQWRSTGGLRGVEKRGEQE